LVPLSEEGKGYSGNAHWPNRGSIRRVYPSESIFECKLIFLESFQATANIRHGVNNRRDLLYTFQSDPQITLPFAKNDNHPKNSNQQKDKAIFMKNKNKKRANKDRGIAIAFAQKIYASPNQKKFYFYDLKYTYNPVDRHKIINKINDKLRLEILKNPTPKAYNDLKAIHRFDSTDNLLCEIEWYFYEIITYKKTITTFLENKNLFELSLLDGKYENSRIYLDKIIESCGVSLWSLENEFALREYSGGLQSNLEFFSELSSSTTSSPWVILLASFYSDRADKNISPTKYFEKVNSCIEEFSSNEVSRISSYLKYKLDNFLILKSDRIHILQMEENSSIIDRYETFKAILHSIIHKKEKEKYEVLLSIIKKIKENIEDVELDIIFACLTPDKNNLFFSPQTKDFLHICDLYSCGKYEECIKDSFKSLAYIGNSVELYDLSARSMCHLGEQDLAFTSLSPLQLEIIDCLKSIYSKDEKFRDSFRKLYKISLTFYSHKWARQLYTILISEFGSEDNSFFSISNLLNSQFINPKLSLFFNDKNISANFLHSLTKSFGGSTTINFLHAVSSGSPELLEHPQHLKIPHERATLYLAKIHIENLDYDKSIAATLPLIDNFKKEPNFFYYEKAFVLLSKSYMKTCNYKQLIILIVDSYFTNENTIRRLNTKDIYTETTSANSHTVFQLCQYPILCYISGQDLYQQYVACDNFLKSHKAEVPSELNSIVFADCVQCYIFLLYAVFNEGLISKLYSIESTEEVEAERIKILHKLILADPSKTNEYIAEINEISKRITIRKYIQFVEESKIHIDIEGVKKYADDNIKDSFDRYHDILKFKNPDINIVSINRHNLLSIEKDGIQQLFLIEDAKLSSFKTLFYEILDTMISSKEFGLNNYLSTRIRHGTLSANLRKPFDDYKLISKIDSTGHYAPIEWWQKNLLISEDEQTQLHHFFSLFSERIDTIINQIKTEWIQIKTENRNADGLFNFIYTNNELYVLLIQTSTISNWNDFFQTISQEIINRIKTNLEFVRFTISVNLKHIFLKELTLLYNNMQTIESNANLTPVLTSIISCKTQIQTTLQQIAYWFNLSQDKNIESFDLVLAVEASLELISNLYNRTLKPSIHNNLPKNFKINGLHFNHYFDILTIIFENIVRHSELTNDENEISITMSSTASAINLLISNKIGPTYNHNIGQKKISTISSEIANQNFEFEKTSKEGGTGILKIVKIIKHDLKSTFFSVTPALYDEMFQISIGINAEGLGYENTNN